MSVQHNVEAQRVYQLPLMQFYATINKARRAKTLMPVEPAIISVRMGVKFAIMRKRPLMIANDRVHADKKDVDVLEQIISQLFDAVIPGGLISIQDCGIDDSRSEQDLKQTGRKKAQGMFSRVFGRFVGDEEKASRYDLNVNGLILAVVKLRALMGHKPIPPSEIRSRCAQIMRSKLNMNTEMRETSIVLDPAQLDTLAEAIRQEFKIMFDDFLAIVTDAANVNTHTPS